MKRYAIVCDCVALRLVAWIDDDRRGSGSVTVGALNRFTKAVRNKENKRGGTTLYTNGCIDCGKYLEWTEQTVGEVLDAYAQMTPEWGNPPVIHVPAPIQPERDLSADEQQARREYRLRMVDAALGNAEPPQRDPRWYKPATVFEDRYRLDLSKVCDLNRRLRERGKSH
jgi:hypothetical protein